MGIYGDFLYGALKNRHGSGPIETISGPTIGPLLELGIVNPLEAIVAGKSGQVSHFAAKELQALRGFVPGNNIFYTKAVMDHLVWNRILDSLSPGYLASMRSRSVRDFNQDWWWAPGDTEPDRGPALAR